MENIYGKTAYLPIAIEIENKATLPDWFWDRIACLTYLKPSLLDFSFYDDEKKTSFLTPLWGNFARTENMWKSSLSHEFGHAYHYNTKLAHDTEIHHNLRDFYKEAKEALITLTEEQKDILKSERISFYALRFQKNYANVYTLPEIMRYLTVVGDIFASLSVGELGFGHPVAYWQDAVRRFHELWANSTDVYFNGNMILQDCFPVYFQMIQKFWQYERNREI